MFDWQKLKGGVYLARKPKVVDTQDNFDDSHEYFCCRCGKKEENPVRKFYKSEWSKCFVKNSKYAPLCISCADELFNEYERKYGTKMACIFLCHHLDIPFYYSLYNSILNANNHFSIGLYKRQLNNKQYQYQDFTQSILAGEIGKTQSDYDAEKEVKWSKQDNQNKAYAIEVVGYDPFEDYPEEDRRFLFNQLVPYLEDDDIADDTFKLSQILQIVNNNNQIRMCDKRVANLDPIKDATDIKTLNTIKKDLVVSNDKIAKENEISVKNRSNKDVGKSTLTFLMRDLREKDFDKAEADYYDQLSSAGSQWATSMSQKALLENCVFDENDKKEIYEKQLNLINSLYAEVDEKKEQIRLYLQEIDRLKKELTDIKEGNTN